MDSQYMNHAVCNQTTVYFFLLCTKDVQSIFLFEQQHSEMLHANRQGQCLGSQMQTEDMGPAIRD